MSIYKYKGLQFFLGVLYFTGKPQTSAGSLKLGSIPTWKVHKGPANKRDKGKSMNIPRGFIALILYIYIIIYIIL